MVPVKCLKEDRKLDFNFNKKIQANLVKSSTGIRWYLKLLIIVLELDHIHQCVLILKVWKTFSKETYLRNLHKAAYFDSLIR